MPPLPDPPIHRWQVVAADEGARLDLSVARHLDESRNRVHAWIRAGRVIIAGHVTHRGSRPLQTGEWIECRPTARPDTSRPLAPEQGDLKILWEDPHIVVIDKPAGIAIHPGAGREEGTLAHRLVGRFPEITDVGHPRRPGIVHRLDLGTTGAMVVARNQRAYLRLTEAFSERRIEKTYLAIVYGKPSSDAGEVRTLIVRDPSDRRRMKVSKDAGRDAVTLYRALAHASGLSLLEIDLRTGRTHQIRVHLKSLGHPLVGDPVYGEARWKTFPAPQRSLLQQFSRPALHAHRLVLHHPETGNPHTFVAPVPEDLEALWTGVTGIPLST